MRKSASLKEGFLYAVFYKTESELQHAFSVMSCPYGKTRLFLLFQSFSDEYTVCEWSQKLEAIQSSSFNAFRAPMSTAAMIEFVQLWRTLEGKQRVTHTFAQTYSRLTGAKILSHATIMNQEIEAKLFIHAIPFNIKTIDQQIDARFRILEKFSWFTPKNFSAECQRGAFVSGKTDPRMERMILLQKATFGKPVLV